MTIKLTDMENSKVRLRNLPIKYLNSSVKQCGDTTNTQWKFFWVSIQLNEDRPWITPDKPRTSDSEVLYRELAVDAQTVGLHSNLLQKCSVLAVFWIIKIPPSNFWFIKHPSHDQYNAVRESCSYHFNHVSVWNVFLRVVSWDGLAQVWRIW